MVIRLLTRGWIAGVLIVIGALLIDPAQAQTSRFDVSGAVIDSAGVSLPSATVVVLTRPDSVLTKFTTTHRNGAFTLRRLPVGAYILQLTFVGYQTYRTDFSITDADVDVGTVIMEVSVSELGELVVSADHIPFIVKRDTLDYNANAFATRPNATVEDLLRRLPGIEVEEDGTIKAQGEEVKNVLVDGKEFFGSDPTIATKNLPADAIERVQVYDKQSDIAEFTGIRDGEEEKTINLVLKEEAKRGYFGKVTGGIGGEGDDPRRYDGQARINRFSPTTQLSVIANANNVNQAGFSGGNYLSFIGGMQGLMAAGARAGGLQFGGGLNNGFSETLSLGLNASRDFAAKSWIRSSYFLSSFDNLQERAIQQQQLLGSEASSFVSQTSTQTNDNLSHRINLNAQHTFTEGHDLRLRGNLNASASSLSNSSFQETQTATHMTQNTAATNYVAQGDNLGGNARLTWRKRFNERGRSIVATARVNLNDSDLSGDLSSTTGFYDRGDVVTYDEILQEQARIGYSLSQTQRISLIEPLGKDHKLEVFGEHSTIDQNQTKSVYDLETGTPVFNDLLSSGFERTYSYLRGGLRFNRNTENTRFVLGLQVQGSHLDGTVLDLQEHITNGYTHFLPFANFGIQIKQGSNLDFSYRTTTREPSMVELQPFVDNSDPLHIYVGNPELTPEYSHRFNAHYRFFDQFSFMNLFTSFSFVYTKDKIVQSRTVDEQFRQVVTSVNSDEGWLTNGSVYFGTPLRSLGLRLNLSTNFMYSAGSEFVNQAENRSRILRNTLGVNLGNRVKDIVDIRAGGRFTINNVNYSLNKELNQNYVNSTFHANGTYYLGEAWTFNMSLNYRVYDQEVFGPGQNVALLEASISRLFMNDRAEIQLRGRDLLNQNQSVNFTNASTYIQQERITSLGRYLMLKFIYRLAGPNGGKAGASRR